MKRIATIVSSLLALALVVPGIASAETAFQLGVPGLNAPADPDVNGMRLSVLYGNNERTKGLDLGFFSISQTGERSGLAFIFGLSRVVGDSKGAVNFSLVNYNTGTDEGVNGAFINLLNDTPNAFNTGFVTVAQGSTGIDLGGLNMSKRSKVQIGFINVTEELETFQFGFINVAPNGFLPVFPIFNFPKQN